MCLGYQKKERERLKIKAFYVQLVYSNTHKDSHAPQILTLHYLPRINGSVLEISRSSVRPDSSAFVTLHRVVSPEKKVNGGVMYGSREKVRASEGLKFEIYMGDVKVLNGIFRKSEGQNWKMECTCGFENDDVEGGVKEAEVSVVVEGDVAGVVNEKVVMAVRRVRKTRGRCPRLEGILEEREVEDDEYESDGCCCCECKGELEMDGGDFEMEGVRWVVDVGIWVMCLGVGYLVTKASSKRLRRNFI